jgi:hypothetical protein
MKNSFTKLNLIIQIITFTILFLIFFCLPFESFSQIYEVVGFTSFAMGKNAVLSFSDASSISLNPANITNAKNITTSLLYTGYQYEGYSTSFGVVVPTVNCGYLGVNYYYKKSNDIKAFNSTNQQIESFHDEQKYFVFTYGNRFKNISYGFNAKLISHNIHPLDLERNFALDCGIQYYPEISSLPFQNFGFGISFENFYKPSSNRPDYFVRKYRFIIEKRFKFENSILTVVGNLNNVNSKIYHYDKFGYGIEYCYKKMFFRLGNGGNRFMALSTGIKISSFFINYIYGTGSGSSNSISLSCGL